MPIIQAPSYGPRCPNHNCLLEGMGFPMPKRGTGICPVSKCPFDYQIDTDESHARITRDKDGNMLKEGTWIVSGDD